MSTMAIPKPRKAEKKRVKLKMAVQGPSGSGKTWGALSLARNLWPQAKICVIDTENESSELYADRFDFDTIPLSPPFTTARYVECIDMAVKSGYDVLIIDTITAQWDGDGGILRRKEELERKSPGANGYALWAKFTPEHEAFKQVILQSPIHVIATMRSKQEYALQTNEKGKQVPVKMGLAPIQRDQMDYEFTLVFDVSMTHIGTVSKDRTSLFNEKTVDLADPKTAEAIAEWLGKGKEEAPGKPEIVRSVAHRQLEAAVAVTPAKQPENAPQTAYEAAKATVAKQGILVEGNLVTFTALSIAQGESKTQKRPFLEIKMNGDIVDERTGVLVSTGFCWDTKLFPVLKDSLNKECVLEWMIDKNGFLKFTGIISVNGRDFVEGQLAPEPA